MRFLFNVVFALAAAAALSLVFPSGIFAQAEEPAEAPAVVESVPAESAESAAAAVDAAITDAETVAEKTQAASASLIDRLSLALVRTRLPIDRVNTAGTLIRIIIAVAIVIVMVIVIWVVRLLNDKLFVLVTNRVSKIIKPIKIKTIRILEAKQILSFVQFLLRALKLAVTVFLVFITLPMVFGLFPLTQNLAATIFAYIFNPVKSIFLGFVSYIPNLFTIAIIILIMRYVFRSLKFLELQIETGKLTLPGFYPEWAQPTYTILRVVLYAFTVAIVYPYLPGSGSAVFQGVSVLVGVLISFGSSAAIANLVAGFVLIYMRAFKIGDLIKVNDVTGFVVEKSSMVTRLRTFKNEYVTFPNNMVLNASVVNYHTSSETDKGFIIHTEITFGYSMPWQKVHELLISAATKTEFILSDPPPYVHQTALNDFYANYEINAYTRNVEKLSKIYSELHRNIQDAFAAEHIDLTAPHFRMNTNKEL
ncbi:MAG: mechanosensitive ion channel family protein [Spirochaetaceae bacterium]|jgi:small-conductance mechanosensitive channel|nr:mechanosensitive ion channel family protein [Spirochaetaceae bacterium]